MPYALDRNGRPIFLISTMAMHTQNLQSDARRAFWSPSRMRAETHLAHRESR